MLVHTSRLAGAKRSEAALPFSRLFIVFVLVVSFALGFAELVRQTDQQRPDQSASSRCDDVSGAPCPDPGLARMD